MEEQIPKEFMCPNCKTDIRLTGLYAQTVSNYVYDHDQKKFVIEGVSRDCDERLFCQCCSGEFDHDFGDGLSVDSDLTFKRKITRYGNIAIEEEYKL